MSLGCCPYAIVSLFPPLLPFSDRFVSFQFGAVAGAFVHWLQRTFFAEFRIVAQRIRLQDNHPIDYLLSTERQSGENYFLLLNNVHAVGVHMDQLGPIMHCALHGKGIPFNWDSVTESGGSTAYRGALWQLYIVERSF